MEIQEKISKLMENEAFVKAFEKVQTPDDVVVLFHENGVEVPLEIAEELFTPLEDEDGELSLQELNDVAGGKLFTAVLTNVYGAAGYLGGRLAGWSKKSSKAYAKKAAKVGTGFGMAFDYLLGT